MKELINQILWIDINARQRDRIDRAEHEEQEKTEEKGES